MVEDVKIVVIVIIRIKRINIYADCNKAPEYILRLPNLNTTSPVWIKKTLKIIKKSIINNIGLIAFKICLMDIFEAIALIKTNIAMIP